MKSAWLAIFSLAIGLAAAPTAHAQAQQTTVQEIIKRGEIVVAIDLATPPSGFLDEKQQPAGFGPELAKLLADGLGVKLEIARVTGPTRIPTLLAGRADVVISTLSVTAERAIQVWFTNPYAANPLFLAGPAAANFHSFDDLVAGTVIAVPRGGPQDQIVTAKAPKATILRFDEDAAAQQAMFSGQAALVGTGGPVIPYFNKVDPGKGYEVKVVLSNLYQAMAVAPGNVDLLQYLNTFIFHNQSGKLEELSQKYYKIPIGNLPSF